MTDLTPSSLAKYGPSVCADCRDLLMLAKDVIEELPTAEEANLALTIARFAGFAALCGRQTPIPGPDTDPCSVIGEDRKCKLKELMEMTPEEKAIIAGEIANSTCV